MSSNFFQKKKKITKPERFVECFYSHLMHLLALLGLLTDRNERFPYLFIYFNQGNHYSLSYTANLQKVPLSRGASLYKSW